MTQLAKLYAKMVNGRSMNFAEFERLLAAFGYRFVRQRGSHRIWRNDAVTVALFCQRERMRTSINSSSF